MSKDKYEEEFIKATNIVKDEKAEDNYKPSSHKFKPAKNFKKKPN